MTQTNSICMIHNPPEASSLLKRNFHRKHFPRSPSVDGTSLLEVMTSGIAEWRSTTLECKSTTKYETGGENVTARVSVKNVICVALVGRLEII